jgi:hypothetical protein
LREAGISEIRMNWLLHVCKDCKNTWFPFSKHGSRTCPYCDSQRVAIDTVAVIFIGVVMLMVWGVTELIGRARQEKPVATAPPPPAANPGAAEHRPSLPVPRNAAVVPPFGYVSVETAKQAAIKSHPDLGKAGTAFNSEYVARYKRYQAANPDYFRDTSWPVRLADEVAQSLALERR